MFMNSDHAGDKVSCRSRSGFLIYVNTALVQWFSKKQSTVVTSVFGAQFVTMKQGIDAQGEYHRFDDISPLWAKEEIFGQ